MSEATRQSESLASHAVCAAAGARDGLRTAQFFVRILAGTESWGRTPDQQLRGSRGRTMPRRGSLLSGAVSRFARFADRVMTWGVNGLIAALAPDWRKLPSPFTHGMMNEVSQAIRTDSFLANPLFNAYFYRSAVHILHRYWTQPFLVLEHRVDAARRMLAASSAPASFGESHFLASALIALVEAGPVARAGQILPDVVFSRDVPPAVAVYAIACVALLFAEEGKPAQELDEDQFFAVVGALIGPRLETITALVAAANVDALARELSDMRAMY